MSSSDNSAFRAKHTMRTKSRRDKVKNHENRNVYFDLNANLKTGNLERFKLVLQQFSKCERKNLLNYKCAVYGSPLHRVILSNRLSFVKYMVESCGLDVNSTDDELVPPLWCAYDMGYMHIVRYLLSKGANARQLGPNNENLLFEACKNRQMSLVKYLLENKLMDVNQEDEDKNNCAYQLFLPKREISSIICDRRKVPLPSRFLRLLLKHGLDTGHINNIGKPLLQYVIDRRNRPCLRLLEKNGAFIGITQECDGLSPIIYAAMRKQREKVVDYMLKSDYVVVSDKIIAANLLASQLAGEKQLQYFAKAIGLRNEASKDFNYAAFKDKLPGRERKPESLATLNPPGSSKYKDVSIEILRNC